MTIKTSPQPADTPLSPEAKVCIGAWWNTLLTERLTFHRPWIMTPRTRKGLDELVRKGFLTVGNLNRYSEALVWKPTEKMIAQRPKISSAFMQEHGRHPITDESRPKPKT